MAGWLLVSGQGLAFIPALYQKRRDLESKWQDM